MRFDENPFTTYQCQKRNHETAERLKGFKFRRPFTTGGFSSSDIMAVKGLKGFSTYWESVDRSILPDRTWPRLTNDVQVYDAMAGKRPYSPYDWSRWDRPVKPLPLAPETGAKRKIKGKRPLGIFLPPLAPAPAKPSIPM